MSEPEKPSSKQEKDAKEAEIEIGWGPAKFKGSPAFLSWLLLGFVLGVVLSFAAFIYAQQPSILIDAMISKAITQTLAAQPTKTFTPTATDTPIPTNTLTPTKSPIATMTVTPLPTDISIITSNVTDVNLILSEYIDVFDFNSGDTEGWKPFVLDSGWIDFEKSGSIEVVDSNFVLDGHNGPFLKYPLYLGATDIHASTKRNAIYKPIDEKIIGVIANVYYESEPSYSLEEIHAGFIVPHKVGNTELQNEDFLKRLIPNKWNTIVWSLYGPVWWGAEERAFFGVFRANHKM